MIDIISMVALERQSFTPMFKSSYPKVNDDGVFTLFTLLSTLEV